MPKVRRFIPAALLLVAVASAAPLAQTQQTQPRPPAPAQQPAATKVTSPMQEWGKNLGDDYFLTNYQQLLAYWKKLDGESPRMQVVEIGKTGWGKPQMMAIITAPENFSRLERYKEISRRLALAEGLTDAEARALAKEGKSVVWIDGGLHATEVLGAQQLMEMVYQMVSRTDEETVRFLNDVILLCVLANPDGMDMVSDQYMKHSNTADSAALQPLRGSRRQPRLVHERAAGDREHQPRHVPRVVPAGRCTTITRPGRRARSCSRRPSAIRSTTTSIR